MKLAENKLIVFSFVLSFCSPLIGLPVFIWALSRKKEESLEIKPLCRFLLNIYLGTTALWVLGIIGLCLLYSDKL